MTKESQEVIYKFHQFGFLFWYFFFLQQTYSTPLLSVMKTFAMMLGDINYHDAFLDPLLSSELPYPFLSYTVLIIFTLLIPILLMNLLVSTLFINIRKWLSTGLYTVLSYRITLGLICDFHSLFNKLIFSVTYEKFAFPRTRFPSSLVFWVFSHS